jgi:hypothetical protein
MLLVVLCRRSHGSMSPEEKLQFVRAVSQVHKRKNPGRTRTPSHPASHHQSVERR